MIISISGQDTYRSRQYLKQTIERFKKERDPQGYNVVVLDGKNEELGKIIGEIRATPFLSPRRMIVINNVLSNSDKGLLSELIIVVKENKIPESNIVVFWQGETISKVKEAKELEIMLKKQKYAQEFELLKGVKLNGWIKAEIEKQGGKISAQALTYLALNAGYDMWRLHSLIEQLVAYKVNEEIQLVDVQLFLDEKIDDNVFNMVDAIVSGNRKQAFKLINEQRRLGEDSYKLFGLIAWQFRILLEMRDLYEREDNLSSDQMAKQLGIHPFVAKKNLYLVKRLPLAKLKQLHQQLLDIDLKTKTGQGDQSLLIDLFVGKS